MTADQIAGAIIAGERDRLPELWEQVQRYAWKQAGRWAGLGGMEKEDFIQEGFLAMVDALDTWRPEAGPFFTAYVFRVKAAFTRAAGLRTQRDKQDPLQGYVSFSTPLSDDEGEPFYLENVIPDPAAEKVLEDVEAVGYIQQRRESVASALQSLNDTERAVVILRHCYGMTGKEAAKRLNLPLNQARATEAKAMRKLCAPRVRKQLKPFSTYGKG